ncbi:hypothetical protein Curi_c04470 [Gottschalkia acidurici 9a]|uniref:Uncharacterized protein n=1 Tax=Gottschalkia acidurici (strain ATCC 7906 / DSM 604 / BCRC 14475 / CIP 104303 / KCTC 5404 / NCIMB 10678 / 9a) TaxID=1128398 RepID=K0AXL3_GOTA9|nr:hypothetical protein Curi_c04470 [Gottschalkia acidurici 9a]
MKLKGVISLITFLKSIKELSFLLMFISSVVYNRELKLTKWKRKLTKGEMTMYIITSISILVYPTVYILILFGT